MSRQLKIENFDPNGVGVRNGRFIGLPYNQEDAQVVLLTAPWDLTVSSGIGTHQGPSNVLNASYQLDLYDDFIKNAWKMGLYMEPIDKRLLNINTQFRPVAENYIAALEGGQEITEELQEEANKINTACNEMLLDVRQKCEAVLKANKLFGIVGGDHSIALAGIRTCAAHYEEFGILQIDAHMDLRFAYEGFTFSHASVFRNAIQEEKVKKLVQVGIRDYCQEEIDFIDSNTDRIKTFTDTEIHERLFIGENFDSVCDSIIECLPKRVYISFDIDGLMPVYCPNTGTPVPGGLSFNQIKYLIKKLVLSNRNIIGFDLCEVAGAEHEYDGNVAARIAYMLSNYMGRSNGLI